MNQELENYIKQARAGGMKDEQIRHELLAANWSTEEVSAALGSGQQSGSPVPPLGVASPSGRFPVFQYFWHETWRIYKAKLRMILISQALVLVSISPILLVHKRSLALALLALLGAILAAYFYLVLVITIAYSDQELTFGEVLARGRRRFLPFIGSMILVMIITAIGSFLLIIPGIYLANALSLTSFVVVLELSSGGRALSRSRELVKGNWWSVVVVFFAWGIILGIPIYVLSLLAGYLGGEIAGSAVGLLGNFLIGPVTLISTYLIYKFLAAKKPKKEIELPKI